MTVEWFDELDSTMLEARRDPRPGRVIVADKQTAGMGRHGRIWHSPSGEGLYVSIVLDIPATPVLSLALGLAAREAIGSNADLRWPNDVLLNGRKVAGVLAQAEQRVVIAGIGINVSQREFPDDLDTPATSLALEGIHTTREALLDTLVTGVEGNVALPPAELIKKFTAASTYARGLRVRAAEIEGVTCGLDAQGFLKVRDDNGTVHTILAGGVRPI